MLTNIKWNICHESFPCYFKSHLKELNLQKNTRKKRFIMRGHKNIKIINIKKIEFQKWYPIWF